MALLDVDQCLLDPDFSDPITVRRRAQTTDSHGRLSVTETVFPGIIAVVTVNSPSDLYREEDFAYFSRTISVVTQFRLRGQTEGYLPDIVVWRGNNYIVSTFDPYPQFGQGFYQVVCQSMDKNDSAFELIVLGQVNFNIASNSGSFMVV